MRTLAKMLWNNHVSSLIKSKGSKKSQLITLPAEASIRTALMTFVEQDISAIPIRGDTPDSEFLGMLNVVDILNYILKESPESFYTQNVETLLNRPVSLCMKEIGIRKVKIVSDRINLMQLLFDYWGEKACPLDSGDVDLKHLLVNTGGRKYEVITPTDLLRYLLILSHDEEYLHRTKASEIPCGFKIDGSQITHGEEDAWKAFKKLLDTRPFFTLAVVDKESGSLEANLSAVDFLPAILSPNSKAAGTKAICLEESISLLRRPGLSLYAFVRATRPIPAQYDLDPILVKPHFTLADLIEKMAKMKIHQLWRVSQDRARTPIGTVGICDVIGHFCKILEPFYGNETFISEDFGYFKI